jgi:hypothetical protein
MSLENPEIMTKARRARDLLMSQFINSPDVVLIDIGLPPDTNVENSKDEIVIRIHVHEHWFNSGQEERTNFPKEIEGIRIVVIPGDYHLYSENPALGN